ncbi:hypothetical protein E1293_30335 [Actinomadura darangshiensis]|uniref:Uncharacterized protein n=1 Tax=Actinomadura darangshiensis TaxID=705336 RepID=A0A4R5ATN5_9ACTN|nr:hypothetical protein [Actinomadura darangshiensis]TDD73882.1 hypothetical protein E1293_30335 [Actinomadura darangshiensis]
MTGALAAAVVGIAGVGSAGAAQPSHQQNTRQDCRTYSSVSECGQPQLNEKQRNCVTSAVQQGMTERRATVECHAFA